MHTRHTLRVWCSSLSWMFHKLAVAQDVDVNHMTP